jgi:hypothetical protein
MCRDAIKKYFDADLFVRLKGQESAERITYQNALKEFVEGL